MAAAGPALLCFDGSDDARQAIERAPAATGGGRAFVAHVWKPLMSGAFRYAPKIDDLTETIQATIVEIDEEGERQAARIVEEGVGIARSAGFEPVEALVEAAPESTAEKLLEIADRIDARVIVAGAHGHSALGGLLGSVSQRLIAHGGRPTLVIPRERSRPGR